MRYKNSRPDLCKRKTIKRSFRLTIELKEDTIGVSNLTKQVTELFKVWGRQYHNDNLFNGNIQRVTLHYIPEASNPEK